MLLEVFRNALRADAGAALHDDLAIAVDLGEAIGDIGLRDQLAADLRDPVLVGLAHVEDVDVFSGVDAPLEFFDGELGDSVFHVFLLRGFRHNAAEVLVVDELGHGGVGAADRALGILAQLEFAKSHCEGIDQQ